MFTAIPKVQVAESAPKQMNAQRTYNTMWNCVPSQKEQNYLFHIKKHGAGDIMMCKMELNLTGKYLTFKCLFAYVEFSMEKRSWKGKVRGSGSVFDFCLACTKFWFTLWYCKKGVIKNI